MLGHPRLRVIIAVIHIILDGWKRIIAVDSLGINCYLCHDPSDALLGHYYHNHKPISSL